MGKQPGSKALHFDELQRPLPLHLILSTRSGSFIREIPIDDVRFHETLTNGSEISFSVYKEKCVDANGEVDAGFWRKIKDLKLAYCRELDRFYELRVNLSESDDTVKSVTAISLGEAEASQCNLYGIEINTEADIARDDYEPSILYNEENKKSSIIHRLIGKMPHYTIGEVSERIRTIQRTFRFDGKSVYDACQEVGKEVGCLFQFECRLGDNHKIVRTVHVRDMLCTCDACGARGDFAEVCEKCGSTSIYRGYGDDTPIYVSRENLAQNIEFEADVDSVKNCFRLVGGDELMTAAIIAQNPNGSQYLWYISDEMREDMSDELREKLKAYDERYAYYQNEYRVPASMSDRIEYYNNLVAKYTPYNSDLRVIADSAGEATTTIVGYPAVMEAYYHTIDMELFLRSGLMPNAQNASTNAASEVAKLTRANLSPVAVSDLNACTDTTAANAVLNMARCLVRPSFSVKVSTNSYDASTHVWRGRFTVKNYSDEEDTATSSLIRVTINNDLETYIQQKIKMAMTRDKDDPTDIVDLFALDETEFAGRLQEYSLKKLEEFRSACQVCMDVMIQNGVNRDGPTEALVDVYNDIYEPYRRKMAAIEGEIKIRDAEIAAVSATRDENGDVIKDGLQSTLDRVIDAIHKRVDFESFVGEELMKEFASYRRDDVYENTNYISDGLDNRALFRRAEEFLTAAKYEIARAARVHHSIKATLSNLLQMKEFLPIVDDFKAGNRLRVKVDDKLYVLRLTEFEVDYESFELSVVFSDVMDIGSPAGDIAQILGNARSISTTYNAVMHQAEAGKKSSDMLSNIAENGLKLTTHIVGGAHNQEFLLDESGYLGRTYIPETDSYSPEQIRIISNGIYITDDYWETMKSALGKFQYYDPEEKRVKTKFGLIADQVVSNMLLTNSAGIYNANGSVVINDKGMKIVVDATSENSSNFSIVRKSNGVEETLLGVDNKGNLVIKGEIGALTGKIGGFTIGATALYNNDKSSFSDNEHDGVYLGTRGIALGKGNFKVTPAGTLTAKAGQIGGFTIGSDLRDPNDNGAFYDYLKNSATNTAYTVGLRSPRFPKEGSIAIWAGSAEANINSPFYVRYDGTLKATKADIEGKITAGEGQIGGFTIGATALYNSEKTSFSDDEHDGVYLGTYGIALGKGKFKVTPAGTVTAKAGKIAGFTITDMETYSALYSGSKSTLDSTEAGVYVGTNGISLGNAFKVTDAGKVTASNINITGGSIRIKNNGDDVFWVDQNGNAQFTGTVDVGKLAGYITTQQLDEKTGEIEEKYIDAQVLLQNVADLQAELQDLYENISGVSDYTSDFVLRHYHDISADDDTGVVTIGGPIPGNGNPPSFNIANTEYFRRAVLANEEAVKPNQISITLKDKASWNKNIAKPATGLSGEIGAIQTAPDGEHKYIQVQFDLTAYHQASDGTETYPFTTEDRTISVDVTGLVGSESGGISISDVGIYTATPSGYINLDSDTQLEFNTTDEVLYDSDEKAVYGRSKFVLQDKNGNKGPAQFVRVQMDASSVPNDFSIITISNDKSKTKETQYNTNATATVDFSENYVKHENGIVSGRAVVHLTDGKEGTTGVNRYLYITMPESEGGESANISSITITDVKDNDYYVDDEDESDSFNIPNAVYISGYDSASGKSDCTVTAVGTIKVNNGATYENVSLDITGITEDLYLNRYTVEATNCVYDSETERHLLYLESNYGIMIGNGKLLLDVYDEGSTNYVDITNYVTNGGKLSLSNVTLMDSRSSDETAYNNETAHLTVQPGEITYTASNDKLTGYAKITFGTDDNNQRSQIVKVEMSAAQKSSGGSGININNVTITDARPASYSESATKEVSFINYSDRVKHSGGVISGRVNVDVGVAGNAITRTLFVKMPLPSSDWSVRTEDLTVEHIWDEDEGEIDLSGDYVSYNDNTLTGYIEIQHKNEYKHYWINMDTSKVSTGSSTPSSVTYSIEKDTWDDSTKKFKFKVNGSDAGFVSFYIHNGAVRYSYQDNSSGNGESGYWLTLENSSASHDPHISYEATGNGYMVSSTVFFREYKIWAECEGERGPYHYAWMREIDDE